MLAYNRWLQPSAGDGAIPIPASAPVGVEDGAKPIAPRARSRVPAGAAPLPPVGASKFHRVPRMADIVAASEAMAASARSGASFDLLADAEYLQTAPHLVEEIVPAGMHRMEDAAWKRQRWIDAHFTNAEILRQRDKQVLDFRRALDARPIMPGGLPP